MVENNYVVYWLHLPYHTDYNTQGYVGISRCFTKRMKQHSKRNENSHLKNAVDKYGWNNISKTVIVSGLDSEAAILLEEMLRPSDHIGWNITAGGGLPPSWLGKKQSEESKRKQSDSATGSKSSQFKGTIRVVCVLTGKTSYLTGKREIKLAGFDTTSVYRCLNSKQDSHKNYTFERITNEH